MKSSKKAKQITDGRITCKSTKGRQTEEKMQMTSDSNKSQILYEDRNLREATNTNINARSGAKTSALPKETSTGPKTTGDTSGRQDATSSMPPSSGKGVDTSTSSTDIDGNLKQHTLRVRNAAVSTTSSINDSRDNLRNVRQANRGTTDTGTGSYSQQDICAQNNVTTPAYASSENSYQATDRGQTQHMPPNVQNPYPPFNRNYYQQPATIFIDPSNSRNKSKKPTFSPFRFLGIGRPNPHDSPETYTIYHRNPSVPFSQNGGFNYANPNTAANAPASLNCPNEFIESTTPARNVTVKTSVNHRTSCVETCTQTEGCSSRPVSPISRQSTKVACPRTLADLSAEDYKRIILIADLLRAERTQQEAGQMCSNSRKIIDHTCCEGQEPDTVACEPVRSDSESSYHENQQINLNEIREKISMKFKCVENENKFAKRNSQRVVYNNFKAGAPSHSSTQFSIYATAPPEQKSNCGTMSQEIARIYIVPSGDNGVSESISRKDCTSKVNRYGAKSTSACRQNSPKTNCHQFQSNAGLMPCHSRTLPTNSRPMSCTSRTTASNFRAAISNSRVANNMMPCNSRDASPNPRSYPCHSTITPLNPRTVSASPRTMTSNPRVTPRTGPPPCYNSSHPVSSNFRTMSSNQHGMIPRAMSLNTRTPSCYSPRPTPSNARTISSNPRAMPSDSHTVSRSGSPDPLNPRGVASNPRVPLSYSRTAISISGATPTHDGASTRGNLADKDTQKNSSNSNYCNHFTELRNTNTNKFHTSLKQEKTEDNCIFSCKNKLDEARWRNVSESSCKATGRNELSRSEVKEELHKLGTDAFSKLPSRTPLSHVATDDEPSYEEERVQCPNCSRKFLSKSLTIHRVVCDFESNRT